MVPQLRGVDCIWNVMAHAQKPDFIFQQNGQVHLNWQGRQFSWPLAAEVGASAVVMLDTLCSEVVWRVLATHSICQFPLHFPSRASPCAITFQLDSITSIFTTVKMKILHEKIDFIPMHHYLYSWWVISNILVFGITNNITQRELQNLVGKLWIPT
jgi:hypothetical protein